MAEIPVTRLSVSTGLLSSLQASATHKLAQMVNVVLFTIEFPLERLGYSDTAPARHSAWFHDGLEPITCSLFVEGLVQP